MYILQKYHVIYGRPGHRFTNHEYEKLIPGNDKHLFRWVSDDEMNDDTEDVMSVFANEVIDGNWG